MTKISLTPPPNATVPSIQRSVKNIVVDTLLFPIHFSGTVFCKIEKADQFCTNKLRQKAYPEGVASSKIRYIWRALFGVQSVFSFIPRGILGGITKPFRPTSKILEEPASLGLNDLPVDTESLGLNDLPEELLLKIIGMAPSVHLHLTSQKLGRISRDWTLARKNLEAILPYMPDRNHYEALLVHPGENGEKYRKLFTLIMAVFSERNKNLKDKSFGVKKSDFHLQSPENCVAYINNILIREWIISKFPWGYSDKTIYRFIRPEIVDSVSNYRFTSSFIGPYEIIKILNKNADSGINILSHYLSSENIKKFLTNVNRLSEDEYINRIGLFMFPLVFDAILKASAPVDGIITQDISLSNADILEQSQQEVTIAFQQPGININILLEMDNFDLEKYLRVCRIPSPFLRKVLLGLYAPVNGRFTTRVQWDQIELLQKFQRGMTIALQTPRMNINTLLAMTLENLTNYLTVCEALVPENT